MNYSHPNQEQSTLNNLIRIILRLPDSFLEPVFIRYVDLLLKLDNLEKELGLRLSNRIIADITNYLNNTEERTLLDYYLDSQSKGIASYSTEEWLELTQVIMYLLLGGIDINWSEAKHNLHRMKVAYLNQSLL